MLVVNAAWDGLSALFESIAAMIILGERFDDPMKYLGIIFIILGLFFLTNLNLSCSKILGFTAIIMYFFYLKVAWA